MWTLFRSFPKAALPLSIMGVLLLAGVPPAQRAWAAGNAAAAPNANSTEANLSQPNPQAPSAARIVVANADDTLDHWSTCVQPACHPGGKGIAVSTSQTVGHRSPSLDGASMLLTVTADSPKFFTDVLWPYKAGGCDNCTQVRTDFWAYPVGSPHVHTLEYDVFLFDETRQLNLMWGTQWNQSRGKWQIWDQGSRKWVDTDLTAAPKFDAWNHIQFAGHRVLGDTSCGGTECIHYDTLTLNGTVHRLDRTEPAGPIHPGWHSISGFQFQIDVRPVKQGGPATVSEYIDKANMRAW